MLTSLEIMNLLRLVRAEHDSGLLVLDVKLENLLIERGWYNTNISRDDIEDLWSRDTFNFLSGLAGKEHMTVESRST